ncbi:MAG: hypothetical protein GX542_12875 [Rhodococcus sp.]|nr:hypothetical protein [Rhodococcus sp. (in: high G+C Gram-positive bacteria)]
MQENQSSTRTRLLSASMAAVMMGGALAVATPVSVVAAHVSALAPSDDQIRDNLVPTDLIVSKDAVRSGKRVRVRGAVTEPDGRARPRNVGHAQVILWVKKAGERKTSRIVTTDAQGRFTTRVRVDQPTRVSVSTTGGLAADPVWIGTIAQVKVTDTTVTDKGGVQVKTKVCGYAKPARIRAQAKIGGKWTRVATQRSDTHGRAAFRIRPRALAGAPKTVQLRVRALKAKRVQASTSKVVRINR